VSDSVRFLYDPLVEVARPVLPDDLWTVDDPASPTGVAVRIDGAVPFFAGATNPLLRGAYEALDGLDGFGTTAAISLPFSGALGEVPTGLPGSLESDALMLLELGAAGPTRVAFEVRRLDDGGLLVSPMRPLRPGTRHALIATRALLSSDGAPVEASETLRAMLNGTAFEPRLARMGDRLLAAADAAGLSYNDVSAMLAFTTQTITGESLAVAADIRGRDYDWEGPRDCAVEGELVHCEGAFTAWSWRDAAGDWGDGGPVRTYRLPVSIWLPAGRRAPMPTVVFGHGLAHGREVGAAMARVVAPLGVAVVAIDAVSHGEHPDKPVNGEVELLKFFALSLEPLALHPRRLRDNFRQSTYDKLQLLRLLELHPELDATPGADVDLDRMAYIGESFGGIMAIEFLALTDRFRMAALQLAGGQVTSIIADARRFAAFALLLGDDDATPSDIARVFPIVQAGIERGDASNWAPHVLGQRLAGADGEAPPHFLLQLVIDDDTIPDTSSRSLARALDLPQVAPVLTPIGLVPLAGPAPIAGNVDGGARTAGLFQFDRITRGEGQPPEVATHDYMPSSLEGTYQLRAFVESWLLEQPPEIVNPYEALGTPALE
jgi:dienelactone hydrolase